MVDDEISLIVFFILVGLGGIWIVLGLVLFVYEKRKRRKCMSVTYGQIIAYSFLRQIPEPVVEYELEGIKYRKIKRFKAIIKRAKELSLEGLKHEDYDTFIDDRDIVHIIKGPSFNLLRATRELYPVGASIKVFYNPNKPGESYVEKIPKGKSSMGIIFIDVGIGVIIFGIIISLFLR